MTRTGQSFILASLLPLPLILAGAWWGGVWAVAAIGWVSVLVPLLDRLDRAGGGRPGVAFPAAPVLTVVLAVGQAVLLAGLIPAFGGASGAGPGALALCFAAAGAYLGQVGNSNAHELIHAPGRMRHRLGRAVFAAMLFGPHASAHLLVQHVHVGTDADPNSARLGESFWRFLPRAWLGSLRAGLVEESRRLAARDGRVRWYRHPYTGDAAAALAALAAAYALGGPAGLAAFAGLALWAQGQMILADYVQHYGLRRVRRADGRVVPVAAAHSWNAPHRVSNAMMLHAPRHSDHHMHPGKPFPALELLQADRMPTLPHSLPVMSAIALVPWLWRRMMDPRAAAWEAAPTRRMAAK